MLVTIEYTTEIPSEAVTFSVLAYGGTFNGGVKSTLIVEIDMDKSGENSLSLTQRSWGESRKYSDENGLAVSGKPDWYRNLADGADVLESGTLEVADNNLNASWETPDGATHGVRLFVAGGNPLLSLAPAIDGEVVVGLRLSNAKIEYMLSGFQDGFPNHAILINSTTVYKHDCVVEGKDPGDLAPPSEIEVRKGWTELAS